MSQDKSKGKVVERTNPTGSSYDKNDEGDLRHGRERHVAYPVGRYLQAAPFFFTRDKWPAPFVDMYRGSSAFLIAGGPSFADVDKTKLAKPGILTMGINNSVKTFRPDMWCCVDDPANFIRSTWLDPKIMKFVPITHSDKQIFNSDTWSPMTAKVGDCPNVWYYKRNERFNASQFLNEDTINWGNHTNWGGGRSVLLAAVRIMYLLGVRNLYLLGVDLDMDNSKKYHFEQDRSSGSIRGNNKTYALLKERFTLLKPHFEANDFHVYNCNPNSKLKVFEHRSFDDAIEEALGEMPRDVSTERTSGLYDRRAKEKEAAKAAKKNSEKSQKGKGDGSPGVTKSCKNCSRKDIEKIKAQVNEARSALHEAKDRTAAERAKAEANDESFNADKLNELVEEENRKRKIFRRLLEVRKEVTGS